jgi:hypothetical protein
MCVQGVGVYVRAGCVYVRAGCRCVWAYMMSALAVQHDCKCYVLYARECRRCMHVFMPVCIGISFVCVSKKMLACVPLCAEKFMVCVSVFVSVCVG